MRQHEERLRRLAINDAVYLQRILSPDATVTECVELDGRERSLVLVGALVALDGPASAFESAVATALANGATADDIVDALLTTAPVVGSAHVVAAAPRLARALGYDIDGALERRLAIPLAEDWP